MGIQVAPRISFRQMHDMGLGKSLSYVFVPAYFCKPILCFVLSCGIRVASMSSVDSIPCLSGVITLLCEYQSFLIIEIVMSILSNRRASLRDDPIILPIRKINSKFSQ